MRGRVRNGPRGARAVALLALAALAACATGPSRQHSVALNQRLAARDWAGAVADLDASKGEYGDRNALLFWLDKATALHDAGRYAESDQLLDLAELRIEELYTVSLSKGAATFLVNDTTQDYAGQVHERVLLHVLRALNYAYQGNVDGGVVEARKVTAFLAELNDRLGERRLAYRDDGFAQYLSGLLFEDQGRVDDARICFDAARTAWAWYPQVLGVSTPVVEVGRAVTAPGAEAALDTDALATLAAPSRAATAGDGELVFLHYAGFAPRKETRTLQVAWGQALAYVQASDESREDPRVKNALVAGIASNAITVAVPALVQDPYAVHGSRVSAGGARAETALVSDVGALARLAYDAGIGLVTAKAVTRATIKFLLARLAEDEAKRRMGDGWGSLVGIVARAGAASTEVADTRSWRTLPAQLRLARLRLPPGRHDVSVRYLSRDGMPLWEEVLPGVEIRPGRRTYVHVRTAN